MNEFIKEDVFEDIERIMQGIGLTTTTVINFLNGGKGGEK